MAKASAHTPQQIEQIKDQLAMLAGRGKYNEGSNIVRGDGIFAASIERTFGMSVSELERLYGPRRRRKPAQTPKSEEGAVTVSAIEIHEFISGKPNGDRATRMTLCSHFKVQVFNPDKAEPFMAFEYDCFDGFRVSVEERNRGFKAATEYAQNLAQAIGYKAEIKLRQFQAKIIQHTEWQEIA